MLLAQQLAMVIASRAAWLLLVAWSMPRACKAVPTTTNLRGDISECFGRKIFFKHLKCLITNRDVNEYGNRIESTSQVRADEGGKAQSLESEPVPLSMPAASPNDNIHFVTPVRSHTLHISPYVNSSGGSSNKTASNATTPSMSSQEIALSDPNAPRIPL